MKARGEDEANGLLGGGAVVFLFAFGEVIVGDEAGMVFAVVVADRAVGPAISHASLSPYFVDVLCHFLYEREEFFGEIDGGGIKGLGNIILAHIREFQLDNIIFGLNLFL